MKSLSEISRWVGIFMFKANKKDALKASFLTFSFIYLFFALTKNQEARN
jgi:hypothetical protein